MTEDEALEEIRQQKIEELRDQTGDADGESTAESAPAEPVPVNGAAELNDVVGNHDVVLADFYADWCGPCQMLEPVVESIAAETAATVVKVDVDANQRLASEYGVRGVPTLVLFADGEPAERLVGMQDEAQLRTTVENYA
ncbi:thioredoxin [Halobacteria archaeon HArc-gm2]|nr:thioredoxin [Halobacteria archaeon HArc-gm2]